MKKHFDKIGLLSLCFILIAGLGATIPYSPEMEARLNSIETKATLSGDATLSSTGVLTLASDSVGSAEITDASISADDLASSSVTTAKIGQSAITEAKVEFYRNDSTIHLKRIVKATWDPSLASDYGSSTTGASAGLHSLGVALPANALVTETYMYAVTQPVESGTASGDGTIAFQCEDSANLVAAFDPTSSTAGSIISGSLYGVNHTELAAADMVAAIAADCDVSVQVSTDSFSAGKIILFVEFVIVE